MENNNFDNVLEIDSQVNLLDSLYVNDEIDDETYEKKINELSDQLLNHSK